MSRRERTRSIAASACFAFSSLLAVSAAMAQAAPAAPAPNGGAMTLAEALSTALMHHPELRAAQSRVEVARSNVDTALVELFPRLVLESGASHRKDPMVGPYNSFRFEDRSVREQRVFSRLSVEGVAPTGTRYELGLVSDVLNTDSLVAPLTPRFEPGLRIAVSQPLWKGMWLSENLAGLRRAESIVSDQAAAVDERTYLILLEVAEGWLRAARAHAIVQLRQRSASLAKDFEKLTRELIDGGKLSQLDLAIALQSVSQRELEVVRAEADLADALAYLAETLQRPASEDDTPVNVAGAMAVWPTPELSLENTLKAAHAFSPTLRRLAAQRETARAALGAVENAGLPDVELRLDAGVGGLSGQSRCYAGVLADDSVPCYVGPEFHGGYEKALGNMATGQLYSVGTTLSVSIPVPLTGETRSARHALAAVEEDLRAEENRVRARIRRSLREVEQRTRLLEASRETRQLGNKALEAEDVKLRAGRSTGFDLLRAQELLIAAEVQALEATYQLDLATLRLRAAIGQLTPQHGGLFPTATSEPAAKKPR